MSREEEPIRISNSPGSAFQLLVVVSQNWKARGSSRNGIVADWPGSRKGLANALSSLGGRRTDASTSRTYTCTPSAPARSPVFVTVTPMGTGWSTANSPCGGWIFLYANVVYERPWPNG